MGDVNLAKVASLTRACVRFFMSEANHVVFYEYLRPLLLKYGVEFKSYLQNTFKSKSDDYAGIVKAELCDKGKDTLVNLVWLYGSGVSESDIEHLRWCHSDIIERDLTNLYFIESLINDFDENKLASHVKDVSDNDLYDKTLSSLKKVAEDAVSKIDGADSKRCAECYIRVYMNKIFSDFKSVVNSAPGVDKD